MIPRWMPATLGALTAIGVTSAMDAAGKSAFSALPLFPLMALFSFLQRIPRSELGFAWGRREHFRWAVLHPVLVLAAITMAAFAAGAVDLSQTSWAKAGTNLALVAVSTILVAILTEEGFFRGWLWASIERGGGTARTAWIWSSLAFTAWHISAVTLETGFELPAARIPVFLANVATLGAIWGLLRWMSGSVIVASVGHGIWNGGAYVLFGYGTKVGALGIRDTSVFGPESGWLGLLANLAFAAWLYRWWRLRSVRPHTEPALAT